MLLISNVILACFIILTQINENAADKETRTNKNRHNTKKNREVLKKLVDFLNDSERTNTYNDERTVVNIDGIGIQNPEEMKTVMKHLQKNYDYEMMAELTLNQPRVHVIRNPDVLDEFVETLDKEESMFTDTPDILKSTVRRYGDVGFGQAISAENFGKRNKAYKRDKFSIQSNYNNKKKSRFDSRENYGKSNNYNKKSYFINIEKNFNRQKYDSREKFSKRDKYDSRDRFDSRERYKYKNNYNRNKGSNYDRHKENNYNKNRDNIPRNTYDTRNKYDNRIKFNYQTREKTPFRINKAGSRIRSRDEDNEKGLDIPESDFKKPSIITWNLGMSSENNNANKKNDDPVTDNYYEKATTKDWLDDFERRKKPENAANNWGKPVIRLSNKAMDWSEVGVEKTTQKKNNDWSQVGIEKSTHKNVWANVGIDPSSKDWANIGIDQKSSSKRYYYDEPSSKDWVNVGIDQKSSSKRHYNDDPSSKDWANVGIDQKSSSKRYYNDEDFTLKKEIDDFTTQFAPAFTEKKNDFTDPTRNDWDQPIKSYENKYKNRMEKSYTYEYKKQKSDVRSDFGYHSFGRTSIPFVGKRNVYAEN